MLRYLLDTNIVIYVIKRKSVEILPVFNRYAGQMAISAITLAELLHGAEKIQHSAKTLAVVEDFCRRLEVLPYGQKPPCITAVFEPRSKGRGSRWASTTCISRPTPETRD